jgi:hypothetical protein
MPRLQLRFLSRSGGRAARSLPEPTRGSQAQAAVEAHTAPPRVQRQLADRFVTRLPTAMRYATYVGRVDHVDRVDRVNRVGRSVSPVHTPLGSAGRLHPIVQAQLARSSGAVQSTRLFARARTRSPPLSRAAAEPARDTAQIRRPIRRIWRASNAKTSVVRTSPRLQAWAMNRPVDLVWRSNTTATTMVDNASRSATTSTSSASYARSAPAAAFTPPGRRVDETVVHASALDPVLADRLAEDVIRRIDRRARIERERRG